MNIFTFEIKWNKMTRKIFSYNLFRKKLEMPEKKHFLYKIRPLIFRC